MKTKKVSEYFDSLIRQPDLTPHSRNAAMRKLLAITEERKAANVTVMDMERRRIA